MTLSPQVARDNVETANAETILKCDILLQKIDDTIFTNIARAHERATAIHHLEIRNSGLEYIVDVLFYKANWSQVCSSREDDAYTERVFQLREYLDEIEVRTGCS